LNLYASALFLGFLFSSSFDDNENRQTIVDASDISCPNWIAEHTWVSDTRPSPLCHTQSLPHYRVLSNKEWNLLPESFLCFNTHVVHTS